jgi:ABC-type multidrug transport system fused ATPase/permease subunit
MRYRKGIDPSLNNLSFKLIENMKIGIVGRTGAGKSSIL